MDSLRQMFPQIPNDVIVAVLNQNGNNKHI